MNDQPKPKSTLEPFPLQKFKDFCEVLKVNTKDFGRIPFKLLGSQQYILDEIVKGMDEGISTFIILKSRQLGSTTFWIALDLFWAFMYPGLFGAIVCHNEELRDNIKQMVEVYLANLRGEHKVPKKQHNRYRLILKNGSSFMYLVAGTKATTKGLLGTGAGFNYMHASEVSAYGNPEDLKNMAAALSSRYPHRLQIIETTARGFGEFEEMWRTASEEPKLIRTIFVGWWRNELFSFDKDTLEYQIHMPDGDKTSRSPMDKSRMREVKQLYGFDISSEQMAWYRWKLNDPVNGCNGDQSKMDEDFPFTAEHAFVSTGSRFFANQCITDQMRRAKSQQFQPWRYNLGYDWRETVLEPSNPKRCDLKIWEEFNPIGRYIVSCDPAYGSSETADRTAIGVWRAFADRLVQVAEYCSPMTSTHQCAWILAHLCGYYRNVRLIMEIQGPGQAVKDELYKLQRDLPTMFESGEQSLKNCLGGMQQFLYRRGDSLTGNVFFQFKTSPEIKHRMMTRLRDSLELDRIVIASPPVLEEMKTVIYDDGSIEAEKGKKDDRVIMAGLANFSWLADEQYRLKQRGMTMEHARQLETDRGGEMLKQRIVLNYLQEGKIRDPYARPYGR